MGVSWRGVRPELRGWLGRCGRGGAVPHNPDARLPLWFTALILWLSITMTHVLFYFFRGLSRKNGAWEGSFTAFKSISVPWVSQPLPYKVHIYLMCVTPFFCAQFYQTMISTLRYWIPIRACVLCSLPLWSVQEQTCYISTLNPSDFPQLIGVEMRKKYTFLALSLYCLLYFSFSLFQSHWYCRAKG